MKKIRLRKITAGFLSLFLVFFLTPPAALTAPEDPILTLDPLGQQVAVRPVSEAPEIVPSQGLPDFQDPENPLFSPKNGAPVSITSHSYNDTLYSHSNNYWFEQANAKLAHHVSEGAKIKVAVIDTGVDYNHPDLQPNIWSNQAELNGLPGVDDDGNGCIDDTRGCDIANGDGDPLDDNGHGTFVSGIIGAVANNFLGIVGIAAKALILPVKVLNAAGSGTVANVIKGIYYAVNAGAQVLNFSLGVYTGYLTSNEQQEFKDAMNYARSKNVVTVAAAGNDNFNVAYFYPAAIADFAVAAINKKKIRTSWSNYGSGIDLSAAGDKVLSLRANGTTFGSSISNSNQYSIASGTSFSSPIVAGAVALLRASEPLLTVAKIYDRFIKTARDLRTKGFDIYTGYGLVDAYRALTTVTGASSTSTSSSGAGSGWRWKSSGWKNSAYLPDFPEPELGPLVPVSPRPFSHYQWDPTRNHFPKSKRRNPKIE